MRGEKVIQNLTQVLNDKTSPALAISLIHSAGLVPPSKEVHGYDFFGNQFVDKERKRLFDLYEKNQVTPLSKDPAVKEAFFQTYTQDFLKITGDPAFQLQIHRQWHGYLVNSFPGLLPYLTLMASSRGEWDDKDELEQAKAIQLAFGEFVQMRSLVNMLADEVEKAAGDPAKLQTAFKIGIPKGITLVVEDGVARIDAEWWIDAFIGIDLTRLRKCEVCQRAFWQQRKDKRTCSKKCSNVASQARYRDYFKRRK